jgi:hypothetical protein
VTRLSERDEPTDEGLHLLAARAYANEPYYGNLVNETQERLGGATLNDLLSAWMVVVRTAALLKTSVDDASLTMGRPLTGHGYPGSRPSSSERHFNAPSAMPPASPTGCPASCWHS